MNRTLLCLMAFLAVFTFAFAQEEPEYLEPTQQVTFGNREHTSRDAIFFSEINSRGELIIAGYTERDYTFSDVQIMALDTDLNILWSDRISWDGISYDYPVNILIDKEDNVWVVSKNLFSYYARFIVTKYDRTGKKLWEYAPSELIESYTLNMKQHHYFFDEEGYLNFYFYRGEGYDALVPTFFRISPAGEAVDEYLLPVSMSSLIHLSNSGDVYHGFHHTYEPTSEFHYIRIDKEGHEKFPLDVSSYLKDGAHFLLTEHTRSITDKNGNILAVSEYDNHDRTGYHHKTVVVLSVNPSGEVNYAIDHDPDIDKYLLGYTITSENNLVLLTNSQPIEIEDEEPLLTLEIFSEEGDLLYSRKSETVVGNLVNFTEENILLRTLEGDIHIYDYELNLQSNYDIDNYDGIFVPQDLHLIEGNPVLTGTTVAKKYETSDYFSQENFWVRKFDQNGLSAEMSYNGEGTSKIMPHAMTTDEAGNILVAYEEFLGPSNISLGGSRPPKEKKIIKYSPQLELLEEKLVEDTDIWMAPKTEFFGSDGRLNSYVISEDKKSIEFYVDGELKWERSAGIEYDEEIFSSMLDKENNLVFISHRHSYDSAVHKVSPDNDYLHTPTVDFIKSSIILSNNWIFTYTDDSGLAIFSPELKLISSRKLDLHKDHYAHLMEKNNKVLFNTVYGDLVLIFDQFGNEEARFNLLGKLHGSTAFFDKTDALVTSHIIGGSIYLEHGHNWSRGAISRYENIKEYLTYTGDEDTDGDGVPDSLDQCPLTPKGAQINEFGCELIEIDADHFTLKVWNETCPGQNNGHLRIEAKAVGDYLVEFDGTTKDFTDYTFFEGLAPGDYEVCLKIKGEDHTRRCFAFTIEGGEPLDARAVVQQNFEKKELHVDISQGTGPFRVNINGNLLGEFEESEFKFPVHGGDEVEVYTAVECEGNLKLKIEGAQEIRITPNPVEAEVQIFLSEVPQKDFLIQIFNSSGQRVRTFWQKRGMREVRLPAEDLAPGIYFLRIHLEEITNIKFLKT